MRITLTAEIDYYQERVGKQGDPTVLQLNLEKSLTAKQRREISHQIHSRRKVTVIIQTDEDTAYHETRF